MKKILLRFLTLESIETSLLDFEHALRVATAVLLIEVTRADFRVNHAEQQHLRELLKQQFDLTGEELDALIEQAESDADQLISLQHVTRLMNEHYDHAMKIRVIEMMWQIVFADGDMDHYEEHLMRKVADLLYVSHAEFIKARHKAEER
jgi:uncharacterized tellurite resistance protein B-like protein